MAFFCGEFDCSPRTPSFNLRSDWLETVGDKSEPGMTSSKCMLERCQAPASARIYAASVSPNTPLDVRMSVFGRCWVTTIFHNSFCAPWHRFAKNFDLYKPFCNSLCHEDWAGIDMPHQTYITQHRYTQTILSSLFRSWDMNQKLIEVCHGWASSNPFNMSWRTQGEWRSQRGQGQRITGLSSVKFFPWQQ